MNFMWPQALYLFFLVPLFIFLHFYFERKKNKDIIPFGNLEVLVEAISKTKQIDLLKHLPLILKTILFSSLILALCRPTGKIYVPTRDTKIMLLMDISISMEANDIQPNRLIAAKEAAEYFIKSLPRGIQVGLGFFSGNVKILVNPTFSKSKVLNVLSRLDLNDLEPGTAIGDAIIAGVESITFDDTYPYEVKEKTDRMLVLVTDGEANVGNDPIFASLQAKTNNVTIQTIGIGSPAGTIIRGGILTKLDEFTLQEIASLTGGYYSNAHNLNDMNTIYKKIRKKIKLIPQETEITFIPLIGALLILVILQILKWSKFRLA